MAYDRHSGRMTKTNYYRMQAQHRAELERMRKFRKDKTRQVGFSNLLLDRMREALPPGRRISESGNRYYEYRQNRSDRPGSNV